MTTWRASMSESIASDKLIVALDVDTAAQAKEIVDELGDLVNFYKVGWQLFLGTHFTFVKQLGEMGKKVFLDLKMEDIPETIHLAIRNAPDVEFIELMTLKGTSQLVKAAKQGAAREAGGAAPKFLMLTVLSSQDDEDIQEIYGPGVTLGEIVELRAGKALLAECDGLIASGNSVKKLREKYGSKFIIVAPGIRPKGSSVDDHKRTLTPYQAIMDGANYIVVGRPITKAKDKRAVTTTIIAEIEKACRDKSGHHGIDSPRSIAVG